ncbi:MAG: class I SAM-dependent methyltransferase family protein [Euryarchaeota archaeon]|nr:class I SAM-dependent methyltransferase family protein [Euryarchaeota archaeon]
MRPGITRLVLQRYVRVASADAEEVRRRLVEARVLKIGLRVAKEGEDVLFPVEEGATLLGFKVESGLFDFEETPLLPRDYSEILDVPESLRALLPSSFDVIGDIIIIKLPPPLRSQKAEIGKALLKANKNAKVVAIDEGVKGELRLRRVEVVAGEDRTTTRHREYGLDLKVDVARAYFSPRLATERNRVTSQVRSGEVVFDMFAGVGPFAVMIAKNAAPERVYAVDLNPDAYALLVENVAANKVGGKVRAVLGDARDVATSLKGGVDRVIMNLPHGAEAFLQDAISATRPGGVVHFHFISSPDDAPRRTEYALDRSGASRRHEVRTIREVRNYSPEERHFVADIHFAD